MRESFAKTAFIIFCIAVIITAIGLLLSETADARYRTDRSLAIAEKVWSPDCKVSVKWVDNPQTEDERKYVQYAAGWAYWGACRWNAEATIYLTPNRFLGEPDVCGTILHEMGHIVGWEDPRHPNDPLTPEHEGIHSSDPNSIMYPTAITVRMRKITKHGVKTYWDVDRRCQPKALKKITRRQEG